VTNSFKLLQILVLMMLFLERNIIHGLISESKVRSYLLFATSRSVLYVVFGATLAGDVAQIDFMCRNSHLNMYRQPAFNETGNNLLRNAIWVRPVPTVVLPRPVMHPRAKFPQIRAIHGWVIDDSTNIPGPLFRSKRGGVRFCSSSSHG